MLDQRRLRVFRTLYEAGNITQAANALFISRQGLSADIAKLEKQLGVRLFERTTTGIEPTPAADALLDYAVRRERLWEELSAKIATEKPRRRLRVGRHLSHDSSTVLGRVLDFRSAAPDVAVEVVDIEDYRELQRQVRDDRVDVGVGRKIPQDGDLRVVEVYASDPLVLMGEKNPLAAAPSVDFGRDLRGQTVLVFSEDTLHEVEPHLPAGVRVQTVPPSRTLLAELLAGGDCVFPVPAHAHGALMGAGLAAAPFAGYPCCTVSCMFVGPSPSEATREFVDYWLDLRDSGMTTPWVTPFGEDAREAHCPHARTGAEMACGGCRWAREG